DAALAKYLEQKDALHAGRQPPGAAGGLTVRELCNRFLNAKAAARDVGELASRTWEDYKAACDLLVEHFGRRRLVEDLGPDDFAGRRNTLARRWGPVTLGNAIQRIRVVFKFAVTDGLVDGPTRYGHGFKRPSKKTLRLERAKKGLRLFTPAEIHSL